MRRKKATAAAAILIGMFALPVMGQGVLAPIGAYSTGIFDDGAAETVAYDAGSQRLFVTNAANDTVDVLDISDPTNPALLTAVDVSAFGGPTCVDAQGGVVAVALKNGTDPGTVVFLDTAGAFVNAVPVGPLPDKVVIAPDGMKVLTANEGEPNDDYTVDPEGSVSIIDISGGVAAATVATATFTAFNSLKEELLDGEVRIYGPGATVAQDLEPESLTISPDSSTAWVTLQENNAIAILDIATAQFTAIAGLGYKNHRTPGNALDASDKDKEINIATWPVKGMYQPDGIGVFGVGGQLYLITANEGDAREYVTEIEVDGETEEVVVFSEEARVDDLELGKGLLNYLPDLQDKKNLGRLKVTTSPPAGKVVKGNGDEVYNQLYSYGARSLSIWTSDGQLVSDSGDDFELITAALLPDDFNSNEDENDSFDSRSDDKGPEPEDVVVGEIDGGIYAFVTLERVGGVMMYDVGDPANPTFVDYANNRDFSAEDAEDAGDLSPEGLVFIPAADSPTGEPLLAVSNEVSGTVTVFEIDLP